MERLEIFFVYNQCVTFFSSIVLMAPTRRNNKDEESLSLDSQAIITALSGKIDEMKQDFDGLKSELMGLLSAKNCEIEKLNKVVAHLQTKVSNLENVVDDSESYGRMDTVILSGNCIPEVTNGEICVNVVQKLVKDKLRIVLPQNEISVAYRLGKKPIVQGPDKRSLMVKLCRRDTKRDLLVASRNQPSASSSSSPPLYINENLIPKRRTILYALRNIKRSHPTLVAGCSSFEGRVYAYTNAPNASAVNANTRPRNVRHLVNTHESLVNFCRDFVKLPLDRFLDSWDH